MPGANVCTPLITPKRLTSSIRRQRAGSPATAAAAAGAGVVHQQSDFAEGFEDRFLETPHAVRVAHVDREGPYRLGALGRLAQPGGGRLERFSIGVGHAHIHAEGSELGRRREADAARRSGEDRRPVRAQRGMGGHVRSSACQGLRTLHHAVSASAMRLDSPFAPTERLPPRWPRAARRRPSPRPRSQ